MGGMKRWKIYDDELAAVLMEKTSVKLDKPRYLSLIHI